MKRTAIYMRVSSQLQAQEGDSIPAQRTALRKYIEDHEELTFVGEYLDDGISGTKDDRYELQRMLTDVCVGKIDLILVTKMDRLHRSLRNFLNMQDILSKHNCHWLAIWEPMYDSSTPQGKMIINTMMNLAEFEANQTGQRIRQVQDYKVSIGEVISGSTPPGYKIENKHLVPDENADVVREMFKYYSKCGNVDQTMKQFDHYGVFPRTKPSWKFILTNTKYIGVFRDNDHFCEPIIDRALFEDVRRKVTMNVKKSQKHLYIFSGLIKCGECGASFGGVFRKMKRGKEINEKSYRCPKHYYGGVSRCGNTKLIHEHILERYLLDNVRKDIQRIILRAESEPAPVKDNSLRIAVLEKRMSKLKELFINDLLSLEEYREDRNAIQIELASLTAQNAPEKPDVDALKDLLSRPFEQLYDTFSEQEKRFFWRSIIREIRFDADRNIEVDFLPSGSIK